MSEPQPDAVRTATIKHGVTRITIYGVPHETGLASRFFQEIARRQINVDDIIQTVNNVGKNVMMSFIVSAEQTTKARDVASEFAGQYPDTQVDVTEKLARLRVVGIGMRTHSGVAARLFTAVADEGINIENISTGEVVISILVPSAEGERALAAVRRAFNLSEELEERS